MHPQLQTIADELRGARERLHALAADLPEHLWNERPDPDRWSAAECVAHLNLTSAAYLPLLHKGLARARALGEPAPRRYRRDPLGWLLWRSMGPPVRLRTRTAAPFVPGEAHAPAELVEEFDRLQEEQLRAVEEADGLPLGRVRVASPFDPRVKYNLFACLGILPRHQHRHLWQAEQAARRLSARSGA